MSFWRKSGSLVVVWIKSLAMAAWCSFCSGSRSCRTNLAMTCFMLRSCIKISGTVVFGIPRWASTSDTVSLWSLLIAAQTCSTSSGILLVASFPECASLSTDSQPSLKHLCHTFICAALLASSPSLLNHPNNFCGGMFKLNAKFDADSLLYSLSHFF